MKMGSTANRKSAVTYTVPLPSSERRGRFDIDEPMMSKAAGTVMLPIIVSGWLIHAGISLISKATMSMVRYAESIGVL